MDFKDYSLTKENLAYLGLFEPFYDLYYSYKDILLDAQEELSTQKRQTVWPDEITKFANNKSRLLFNDFFDRYSYLFTDEEYIFHANTVFMRHIDLYDIKRTKPLTLEISFMSFERFLKYLEWAVAYLIRNKKEKELSRSFNEETILRSVNNRIQSLANGAKTFQSSNPINPTKICDELTIYVNLKNTSCNQKNHRINSTYCSCNLLENKIVRLPIHYCAICNKYFIGIESLKIYEKTYGKIIAVKHYESGGCNFDNFGESELYQTGYNAEENGMTDQERKAHLKFLIESGKMKPFEIIRDLEDAIRFHKNKFQDRFAVEKWKNDLEYVNKWKENTTSSTI